jgi:hypothetical protein
LKTVSAVGLGKTFQEDSFLFLKLFSTGPGQTDEDGAQQCFFVDGTSRHVTYFDQLREDDGYAGGIETDRADMASSHQVKRFFKAFAWTRVFLFRRLLQTLFLWRLRIIRPEVVELGIDTMVMDNDDALCRDGVKPTYKNAWLRTFPGSVSLSSHPCPVP